MLDGSAPPELPGRTSVGRVCDDIPVMRRPSPPEHGAGDARVRDLAAFAERHNAALDSGYDCLQAHLGAAPTIALGRERFAADAAHRWTLEPYHYEPAYNAEARDRLRTLIGV